MGGALQVVIVHRCQVDWIETAIHVWPCVCLCVCGIDAMVAVTSGCYSTERESNIHLVRFVEPRHSLHPSTVIAIRVGFVKPSGAGLVGLGSCLSTTSRLPSPPVGQQVAGPPLQGQVYPNLVSLKLVMCVFGESLLAGLFACPSIVKEYDLDGWSAMSSWTRFGLFSPNLSMSSCVRPSP